MSECPVLLSRVLFCQRLVWLVNISSNPQRTCPSEERPQTCYCSDYMSIKHLLIERERENRRRGREEEAERVAHGQIRRDGLKARGKQPERKGNHG